MNRALALKASGLLLLIAAALAFPQVFTDPAVTLYGVFAMIYIGVASAWNIFSGNTGYISLGHAVFYGSGAYAFGVAAQDWNLSGTKAFLLLPLAGAVGAVIAVPVGLIALRVRRHTFIVLTIAFFFIFQLMAYNLPFTHGTIGLNAPFLNWSPVAFNTNFYYITLAFAAGTIALSVLIRRSVFGLQLRAIRDDEDRARGLGVKTMRVKLSAFVISGTITAMIGAVWFFSLTQVQPDTGFDALFDLTIVLMVYLGGYGSIAGPVLGALIIEPGSQWLNTQPQFAGGYLSEILLGVVFLLVVIFLPRGILPTAAEWIKGLRSRGRPAVTGPGPAPDRKDRDPIGRVPQAVLARGDAPPDPPTGGEK